MSMDPSVMGNLYSMMAQLNKMYPLGANQSGPNLSQYNPGNRGGAPIQQQGQQQNNFISPPGNSQVQPPMHSGFIINKGNNTVPQPPRGEIPTNNPPWSATPLQPTGQLNPVQPGGYLKANPIVGQQGGYMNANPIAGPSSGYANANPIAASSGYANANPIAGPSGAQQGSPIQAFIQQALQQGIDPHSIFSFIAGQTGLQAPATKKKK